MHTLSLPELELLFNREFTDEHTVLKGGYHEPFYKAWNARGPAEIQYREDYLRSALHEVAHWCVAGKMRRTLDDFGYWYNPDGRSLDQQKAFYQVEVKPQAIELEFCKALQIPFDVSCDNLSGDAGSEADIDGFKKKVVEQWEDYRLQGFPPRALRFAEAMRQFHL